MMPPSPFSKLLRSMARPSHPSEALPRQGPLLSLPSPLCPSAQIFRPLFFFWLITVYSSTPVKVLSRSFVLRPSLTCSPSTLCLLL